VVLGEPEVQRPREELAAAVDAPRGQQLLRADQAELLAELRAEHVLPAVPARQRQVRRAVPAPAGQVRDELRVLVVGVRRDVEHASHLAELLQVLQDLLPPILRLPAPRREHGTGHRRQK
jgi:hypothetical protein